MTDTRVADVLDGLYDLWAAEPTLAAAAAAGTLAMFDGPPTIDFSADIMLVVGGSAEVDDDSAETAVSWDWSAMGRDGAHADIEEWIEIPCAVASIDGDATAMRAARRAAIEVYATAADAARGSTLGVDQVLWCICAVSGIRQLQTTDGAECLIKFAVRVRTQI